MDKICRFIKVRYSEIGQFGERFVQTKKAETFGLQIDNKIYLLDGHYKNADGKRIKILEEYPPYPAWATPELIEKYDRQMGIGTLFDFLITPTEQEK